MRDGINLRVRNLGCDFDWILDSPVLDLNDRYFNNLLYSLRLGTGFVILIKCVNVRWRISYNFVTSIAAYVKMLTMAGLAVKTQGSFMDELVPFRTGVAGF